MDGGSLTACFRVKQAFPTAALSHQVHNVSLLQVSSSECRQAGSDGSAGGSGGLSPQVYPSAVTWWLSSVVRVKAGRYDRMGLAVH